MPTQDVEEYPCEQVAKYLRSYFRALCEEENRRNCCKAGNPPAGVESCRFEKGKKRSERKQNKEKLDAHKTKKLPGSVEEKADSPVVIDDVEIRMRIGIVILLQHRRIMQQDFPVLDVPSEVCGHEVNGMREEKAVQHEQKYAKDDGPAASEKICDKWPLHPWRLPLQSLQHS